MSIVTVIVADDHQVVRMGLKTLLSQELDFQVIGEAADGLAAVNIVRKLKPHVLVLDLMMPARNGMAVIEELTRQAHRPRIVVLSMHTNEAYVAEALRKGADGYVVKDSIADEIVQAIRVVLCGQQYLSGQLNVVPQKTAGRTRTDRDPILTLREQEVLHLITQGKANKEIASHLAISIRTVEAHRARIMRKLGISSHAGLIHYAIRENFQPLP